MPPIDKLIKNSIYSLHTALKELAGPFPRLAEIDKAEVYIAEDYYSLKYITDSCHLELSIEYPDNGPVPEPPTFSARINGQVLSGMIFVIIKDDDPAADLRSIIENLMYEKVAELEKQLGIQFNYHDKS